MHLVIFDIDGTLTDTLNLDDEIYLETLKNQFEIDLTNSEWTNYKKISTGTDSGLTKEIFKDKNIPVNSYNIELLKDSFLYNLRLAYESSQLQFRQIPGSKIFYDILGSSAQFKLGIATGSWKESGIIKLNSIGIDHKIQPYGHSDLFYQRKYIIDYVIHESSKDYGISKFHNITYIGDGVWDFHATKELGINFIGVDYYNTGVLSELGAENIFSDFNNVEKLFEVLI